jgi:hypothetical protein
VLALVLTACTSSQVLSQSQARDLGARTWDAATDEVFDATWLTLSAKGFQVGQGERVAGTLVATRGAQTWDVEVAALGSQQRVQVAPRQTCTREELVEVLDVLETGTRWLLRAWTDVPEWKFDGRRNVLLLPGITASPPRDWEWLDFDTSHRHVVVQQLRARTGVNPTLLVDVDRRRPQSQVAEAIKRAAGMTLGARQRLVLPDELEVTQDATGMHGGMRVLDGTLPLEVVWHAYEATLGTADVRLVLVCPRKVETECRGLWAGIHRSIVK